MIDAIMQIVRKRDGTFAMDSDPKTLGLGFMYIHSDQIIGLDCKWTL